MRTVLLLVRGHLRLPRQHVGWRLQFADGTSARVYRETVVTRHAPANPAVLLVSFELRWIRRASLHALFRIESMLNTLLFAGFRGLVSKLWLAHDERHVYRGLYEWDDPDLAERYVRTLWWALVVISAPGSIHYEVLPGLRRDLLLARPRLAEEIAGSAPEWWRLIRVESGSAAARTDQRTPTTNVMVHLG